MKNKALYLLGILVLMVTFVVQGASLEIFAVGEQNAKAAADQTIDISVEKVWQDGDNAKGKRPDSITVDLKNGDSIVKTITIQDDGEGNWQGSFEDVPRFDESGTEINYTIAERSVEDYEPSYEHGEIVSHYDYPTNVSDVELETPAVTTPLVNVARGDIWKIQPGLRTDFIEGTRVVFNPANLTVSKARIKEYDADWNLVPQEERRFIKASGRGGATNKGDNSNAANISYIRKAADLQSDGYYETDHVLEVTFPGGVTVLDGTSTGSSLPVVVTISNYSVYNNNRSSYNVLYGGLWADANDSRGVMMDINFTVPGLDDGSDILLSFVDIDVTSGSSYTRPGEAASRLERVYLFDGFDKTIYTVPLETATATNTRVSHTSFMHSGDNMCAYARSQDSSTLQGGFVAKGSLDEDGFTLRWTGSGCATQLFAQIKPFKLKVTADENTASANGGNITEQGEWKFRDYGQAKVITVTPDPGYHIRYLKIDGEEIALDGFDEDGYMEVTRGYTVNDPALNPGIVNTGTETVKLYQRENGVIDVYLPAQYFAVNNTAPTRSDHWIDTGFESNGLAEDYVITNKLLTTVDGTKTWVAGNAEHVSNDALELKLKQKFASQEDSEAVEYPIDRSQIKWTGDSYSITGLPAYDADGNEYAYIVEETPPAGYEVTQDGNDITNTLRQQYITVQGRKTWKDGGKEHNNAEELTITLYRAAWDPERSRYGEAVEQDQSAVWTGDIYKFENLPRYDELRYEYWYTVTEEVDDSINTDPSKGDYYECVPDSTGRNFINTLKGTTSFSGTKTWLDGGRTHDNTDTEQITTVLYNESETQNKSSNVNTVSGARRVPEWDGDTFTYNNLPKYDENGYPYTYSVRESRVMGKNSNAADYDIYYDGELWDFSAYDTPAAAYNVTGKDITNALRGSITVSKTWDDDSNRDGKRPSSITVHLKKGDTEVDSAELTAEDDWTHMFENLSFYDANGERINYTVTEDPIEDEDGNATYTATVGDLEWNKDKTGCTISVENKHDLEKVSIPVEKVWVDGDDVDELRPESVTVTLYADGIKTDKTLTLSANDDTEKNWKGAFTGLDKNKPGEVGEAITYTVKEEDEDIPAGYTGDVEKTENGFKVTNTHVTYTKAAISGTKTLTGRDMAAGEFKFKVEAGDETTAAAVDAENVVLPAANAESPASADGVAGSFTFGNIVFKEAGTYKFKVSEVVPDGDDPIDGITYDRTEKEVTITVVKEGNELAVKPQPDFSKVAFDNTYSASGEYTPAGEKTLKGQSETDDGSEETPADVTPADDQSEDNTPADSTAPAAEEPQAAQEDSAPAADAADAQADETVPSEELSAESDDARTAAADDADEAEATPENEDVSPAAEEGGDKAEESAPAEEAAPASDAAEEEVAEEAAAVTEEVESVDVSEHVTTEARAAGGATLRSKQPKGDEVAMAMEEGMFKFEIRYTNGEQYKDQKAAEGSNKAAAAGETAEIAFDKLTYTTEKLKELVADGAATKDADGYHISYYVVETEPDKDYYQNNSEVGSFNVVITDDGKGNLSVVTDPENVKISFTNRYITDTAVVSLDGLKVLNTENGSRTIKEGDFEFAVEPLDGAPAPEKPSASNDAGGAVSFGEIEFTKGDLGDSKSKTFTYEITETEGSAHGMTYDGETKTVTITVTDDGEGKLTATTEPGSAPLFTFNNTYEPDPVSETVNKDIKVTKILKGADLEAGQFSFNIQAADDDTKAAVEAGKVEMPSKVTAENGADGDIVFDKITYNKVGTYTFRITEVIPEGAEEVDGGYELDGIRYDTTEYTAVVVVGDDGEGKLYIESQELSDGSKKAIFTNEKMPEEYVDPTRPDDEDDEDDDEDDSEGNSGKGVKTGDDSALAGWLALLLAAGAGGGAVYRRRRRED